VAKCEDEGPRDSKYRHCFEVNTRGRGYLFCADTAEELESWVCTFGKIIDTDAADHLVSTWEEGVAVYHIFKVMSSPHTTPLSPFCTQMTPYTTLMGLHTPLSLSHTPSISFLSPHHTPFLSAETTPLLSAHRATTRWGT
jgi:hypothetical protein